MRSQKSKPVVGIVYDIRGDYPYVSVSKLWDDTVRLISSKFKTEIFNVDSFYIENNQKYKDFINKIDILFMLSPYYTINRVEKNFPVVAYGLGSMQKGGQWLYDNIESFRSCDSIIFNCKSCYDIFEMLIENNDINYYLIPFGIDTSVFFPRLDKNDIRHKYGIPEDFFIMLYCGRINLQKNPVMLLSILRDLMKTYENLYLMIVGLFDDFYIDEFAIEHDVNLKEYFQNFVDEFDLSSRLLMFDLEKDPIKYAELINVADIGINLTTLVSENFGYTPVEMQACGLPIVGTNWGGLKETIIDGVTGFHVDTMHSQYGARINFNQTKNKIEDLINNSFLLSEFKKNAVENVMENYSDEKFGNNLEKIISETFDKFNNNYKTTKLCPNTKLKHMSELIYNTYGRNQHVSIEHLHPELDSDFYNSVASKCSTLNYNDVKWKIDYKVAKGFDWQISNDKIISYDPRWNNKLKIKISDDELNLLKVISYESSLINVSNKLKLSWDRIFALLDDLTKKGFIMPWKEKGKL